MDSAVAVPRHRKSKPFVAFHVVCAIATAAIPLAVFMTISYHQALSSTEADLTDIVEVARERTEEILRAAKLELTRFVRVTEGRPSQEAENLLREIVYTSLYFREAGIIDERGFLTYSTAAPIKEPIEISRERRSNPEIHALQIVGTMQTSVMREQSVVLALPTKGQGEANLLLDPAVLSLLFRDVDLGPDGFLAFVGPMGRALTAVGRYEHAVAPPDAIRVARVTDDHQVSIIGEVTRDWALRGWHEDLMYSLPAAAVCSALLAFMMINLISQRSGLDHDLRLGMARGELHIEYQPIIELRSGRCVAAEALLRWRHPTHGYVRPDVFIPLAEEVGLIGPLTEWVVRRVRHEVEPLLRRHPELRLSINCASSLLVSRDLEEILRRAAVSPNVAAHVVLEVTESVFLGHEADTAREAMSRLRSSGFRFALDDFGAGYSSLGYLQRFEFEFLKIDRSFVQAIGSSAAATPIFDTLVDLAHQLNLVTVAEGVETEEQRSYVHRHGVVLAQGWLFATALPIGEFENFLSEIPSNDRVVAVPRPA